MDHLPLPLVQLTAVPPFTFPGSPMVAFDLGSWRAGNAGEKASPERLRKNHEGLDSLRPLELVKRIRK